MKNDSGEGRKKRSNEHNFRLNSRDSSPRYKQQYNTRVPGGGKEKKRIVSNVAMLASADVQIHHNHGAPEQSRINY